MRMQFWKNNKTYLNELQDLRENIVKNQGMANNSGMNLISSRWFARTGSWKDMRCENFAKYSRMISELSFKNKL